MTDEETLATEPEDEEGESEPAVLDQPDEGDDTEGFANEPVEDEEDQ